MRELANDMPRLRLIMQLQDESIVEFSPMKSADVVKYNSGWGVWEPVQLEGPPS